MNYETIAKDVHNKIVEFEPAKRYVALFGIYDHAARNGCLEFMRALRKTAEDSGDVITEYFCEQKLMEMNGDKNGL